MEGDLMSEPTDTQRLIEFGKKIRERRKALRMSIRALAADCNISPSYLSSIESGNNPATKRPPEPSIGVVERLCTSLDISRDVFRLPVLPCGGHCDSAHALLYRLDDQYSDLLPILRKAFGEEVKQWVCISEPQYLQPSAEHLITWHWPFGSNPYPDNFLVAERIGDALEEKVKAHSAEITEEAYGIIVADCSAVMRWMVNPEAEVDYEDRWIERSTEIFSKHVGRAPKLNVCMYRHRDLEALSKQIDVLDTILRLFQSHTKTVAVDPSGNVLTGSKAISEVLADTRPSGISGAAWRSLCRAAAPSFA